MFWCHIRKKLLPIEEAFDTSSIILFLTEKYGTTRDIVESLYTRTLDLDKTEDELREIFGNSKQNSRSS